MPDGELLVDELHSEHWGRSVKRRSFFDTR